MTKHFLQAPGSVTQSKYFILFSLKKMSVNSSSRAAASVLANLLADTVASIKALGMLSFLMLLAFPRNNFSAIS